MIRAGKLVKTPVYALGHEHPVAYTVGPPYTPEELTELAAEQAEQEWRNRNIGFARDVAEVTTLDVDTILEDLKRVNS